MDQIPQIPTPEPQKARRSKMWLIVFVVVGLAISSYFAYANSQNQWPFKVAAPNLQPIPSHQIASSTPTPAASNSHLPVVIPSNWISFRHSQYGFEFKLPPGWKLFNESSTSIPIMINYASPESQSGPMYDFYGGTFLIEIYPNPNNLDLQDFFDAPQGVAPGLFADATGGISNITVDGRPGMMFRGVIGEMTSDEVIINDKNRFIKISDPDLDLNAFVSTFKFISDTRAANLNTLIASSSDPIAPCIGHDTLYVFNFSQNVKPIAKISTNLNRCYVENYSLVGKNVYFYQNYGVKQIDFAGNIHSLPFVNNSSYPNFVVSPDERSIVWSETTFDSGNSHAKSTLFFADIDGKNKKVLVEKNLDGDKYLAPIRFSHSEKEIYFSEEEGGKGGYIIFSGSSNLEKVNIETGAINTIFGANGIDLDGGYVSDISSDEHFIVYFKDSGGMVLEQNLGLYDSITKKETLFALPSDEGFHGGGNAYFSPDGKYLAYNVARWNPDDERYRTMILDLTSMKNPYILIDDPEALYTVNGWASANAVLLSTLESWYTISLDESGLKKVSLP